MRLIRPGVVIALMGASLRVGCSNAAAQPPQPPQFDHPPTPACGSEIDGSIEEPISFTIQASDPDAGDVVTLDVAGLPSGATMTPPLPSSGNPVTSDFSWTPIHGDDAGDHLIDFSATDSGGSQVTCEIRISIEGGPDYSIRKTASPNPVFVGNELAYTLTVTNSGPDGVDDVLVRDRLPSGVRFVSVRSDHFVCDPEGPHLIQCLGTPLNQGHSSTIVIAVIPFEVASVTNRAKVGADPFDPNEANNAASVTTRVSGKPVGGVGTGAGGMARRPWPAAMVGAVVMALFSLALLWLGRLAKHSREN